MGILKRNTYQPQQVESIAEPKEGFAMIDFQDIDKVIENLTGAEMKLWLYLQKIDRYGDKWKDLPSPQEFAIRLGLSRRTVEKAAARLDELGLYTFRVGSWQGANSSAARAQQTARKMKCAKKERELKPLQSKPNFSETLKPLQDKGGYLAANTANLPNDGYLAADAANLPQPRLNSRDHSPKPLPNGHYSSPHTIQTYLDFIKTLSEGERESFENFCKKEVAGFPRPIINLCDYLAADDGSGQPRYLDFWQRFGKTKTGTELRSQQAAAALTPELYDQWDKEFRAVGCDYFKFCEDAPSGTPERDLKMKFFDEWDKRNLDVVPLLH